MNDLGDWHHAAKAQHDAADAALKDARVTALIRPHLKAGRATPNIKLWHGAHETGWSVRFTRDGDTYKLDFVRDVATPPNSLMIFQLRAVGGHSGRVDINCPGCSQRVPSRSVPWMIQSAIASLGNSQRRKGHKFIVL